MANINIYEYRNQNGDIYPLQILNDRGHLYFFLSEIINATNSRGLRVGFPDNEIGKHHGKTIINIAGVFRYLFNIISYKLGATKETAEFFKATLVSEILPNECGGRKERKSNPRLSKAVKPFIDYLKKDNYDTAVVTRTSVNFFVSGKSCSVD